MAINFDLRYVVDAIWWLAIIGLFLKFLKDTFELKTREIIALGQERGARTGKGKEER